MSCTQVSRRDHLKAVRTHATALLDGGGTLQDVLDYLAAGLRARSDTDTRLTMRILCTAGVRIVDEGSAADMRKLIGFLCDPLPIMDRRFS